MLFIASRALCQGVDEEARLRLLEKLQEKGFVPLIRSTRFGCYRQTLSGLSGESEMERAIAALTEREDKMPYCRGDLFFFDDYVLYLIFEETGSVSDGIRAGIVYESQTSEPLPKLDAFCREVGSLLLVEGGSETGLSLAGRSGRLTEWREGRPHEQQGFTRFVANQDIDSLYTLARKETAMERVRASELLEDSATRLFLRRAKEAYVEGFAGALLASGTIEPNGFSINKLLDAGLVRREVMISCRKMGHILITLPSPDALAVVTVSHAMCSGCGAAIADEKVEEVFAPTGLASALLEDGSWLANRLYSILRELGIPTSEIALAPPSGHGEAQMMVNVCGESFLFVLRDGDLSPAFARRATDAVIETEATHLMIVVTGAIREEGRLWLLNYARRRTRGGNDFELKVVEGVGAAAAELQHAFEHVSQSALAEQLSELDDSLGLSITRVISTRFQLLQRAREKKGLARLAQPARVPDSRAIEPANRFTDFASPGVVENVSGNFIANRSDDTQLTGSITK